MSTQSASEIEREFARLSPDAQLGLLERLVHCLRVSVSGRHENWDPELSEMAADPEIRRELSDINGDLRPAEADGLGPD